MKTIILLILICIGQLSYSQTNKEQAQAKLHEGIKLEDELGKFDEAIQLFMEAQKLDPENITYPYEIAYAYSHKKEYKKASDILEPLLTYKTVFPRVYQALGNAYDEQGMPDKALETYEKGRKLFPNSGELYLESGNVKLMKNDYNAAISFYEKGIEVDPGYPSNYYRAAKIFCHTDEQVWGMIYGEIFMNLERNSQRTAEISKLLFDTYKSHIKFTSDTSLTVDFGGATIIIDDKTIKDPKNFKLPFGAGAYGLTLTLAVTGEKTIDINSLDRIRTRFVQEYFNKDNATKYPNVLFDYQQKINVAGYLEAYNHWILMKGDETGFNRWLAENKTKWDAFRNWFSENKIVLDQSHKFYRAQY